MDVIGVEVTTSVSEDDEVFCVSRKFEEDFVVFVVVFFGFKYSAKVPKAYCVNSSSEEDYHGWDRRVMYECFKSFLGHSGVYGRDG